VLVGDGLLQQTDGRSKQGSKARKEDEDREGRDADADTSITVPVDHSDCDSPLRGYIHIVGWIRDRGNLERTNEWRLVQKVQKYTHNIVVWSSLNHCIYTLYFIILICIHMCSFTEFSPRPRPLICSCLAFIFPPLLMLCVLCIQLCTELHAAQQQIRGSRLDTHPLTHPLALSPPSCGL
jgi:hypothetical protein